MATYDGRNSEIVLLGVVEELQDIVTDNDTALAGENILDTHDCCLYSYEVGSDGVVAASARSKRSVGCMRCEKFSRSIRF